MCRHETATYACGHREDRGFFCEFAQSYGPFFNKAACPNYSHGAEIVDAINQCGAQKGFYCAHSQDGVVVDKAKDAMDTARDQFNMKKSEFERIALSCSNYLQEAKTRGLSNEALSKNPQYRVLEQKRQQLGRQCTVLRNRALYFNNLLNHALRNRHLLAPGVCHHPEWDRITFDFAHSIFPVDLLQPILHTLPGQTPAPLQAPVPITPVGARFRNAVNQSHSLPHLINTEVNASPDLGSPLIPQAKSMQRPKLMVTITPTKQTTVTEQGSPMSSNIIRGHTPEGEDRKAKAARYREQLTASHKNVMDDRMTKAGYNVKAHGIKPPEKDGCKLHGPRTDQSNARN